MSIKAVIPITDEKGQLFEGRAELFPKEGSTQRKGTLVTKKAQIKKARSKITIRLRQFISEGFFNKSTRRTINEIREKLRKAGFSKTEARYDYGKPGQAGWRLSMKYPILMLNASKLFYIILPFYYLVTLPVALICNYFDLRLVHKSGTGLIVLAWK